jgi:hypothetical protein
MSIEQGIFAEFAFATKCLKHNIEIAKPLIDVHGYDYLINVNDNWLKIQVKSTSKPDTRYNKETSFKIQCRKGATSTAYNENDFHFCAAYIIPFDLFYIIPISELNKTTIRINTESEKCKFNKYKDNFRLLMPNPDTSMFQG